MATSVSQNTITVYFDDDYTVGQYANGDYYVVAPTGLTIIGIDPPSLKDPATGRVMHGAMLNPIAKTFTRVGFDSATSYAGRYDPLLNVARPGDADLSPSNPLVLSAGSSLLCSRTRPTPYDRPQLADAAVFTVVESAPPSGSFRPPYCGTDKTHYWNVSNLDYDRLPRLPKLPSSPTLPGVGVLEKVQIEIDPGSGSAGRQTHPANNGPIYGRDLSEWTSSLALQLCLDYSNSQKESALIRLVQYGLDIFGAINGRPLAEVTYEGLGGYNIGRKLTLLVTGIVLNDSSILWYCDRQNWFGFQEDLQIFLVDASHVALGHDPHAACEVGAFQNITERAHMPATCNNYSMNCNPTNPDKRQRDIYTEGMIGLPEWGEQAYKQPGRSGSNWGVTYRDVNFRPTLKAALAAQLIPGARALWNNQMFFDYHDRVWSVEDGEFDRAASQFGTHSTELWNTYRSLGGPVWTASPPANYAPIITVHPQSRTVAEGSNVTFSVGVDGLPEPTFQWRRNGIDIGGATNQSLILQSVQANDSGSYDVVATNSEGSATSNPATLTVSESPPQENESPYKRGRSARSRQGIT